MRVTSIFTLSLVATALALPGTAQALGLGRLTVDSALGQPLSARIELTSTSRVEVDTLTARVADPALYSQNNLNYQGSLARARVTVETGADGVSYLRVSSPASVLEPYLDLLIEVNWSAGRVVRDYTLLLDPPGTGTQMAEPVAPVRGGAATRGARNSPAPAGTTTPSSAPSVATAPGDGYAVKRGDTLAKIANDTKPADATLDQMLVALFKANSAAFVDNNMNRLRAGAILTVPATADVSATTPTDAQKTVRVQASDWRAYRDRVAAAAPEAGTDSTRTAAGNIGTAVDEKTPAVQPGRDQLRVSRDAQGKAVGANGKAEDAVSRDGQLREAQSRIAQLEKMLTDSQRATDLKNSTMAQLQNRADAAKGTTAPSVTAAPVAPAVTPTATAPAKSDTAPATTPITPAPSTTSTITPVPPGTATTPAPVITTPATPDTGVTPAPSTPTIIPPLATTPTTPLTTTPTDATKAGDTTGTTTPDATKAVPKKAAPKARAEPSLLDQITEAIPLWALGLAALLILILIAALLAQRRRKTTKFEDSIISGTDIKTNTVFGSTGGGVVNTGDNSLASDFSREGLGNIDTDEVDPIAEAEVYLAYGRDAQAEEILKDALKKDPQRQEIYLKLLEIHAQHNKPSAFETVAAELYAVCQGQGETWQKAVALGRQLDPNNPMFADGAGGGVQAAYAAADNAPDSELFTMGPDLTLPPKSAAGGIRLDDEITISPTSARPKTPGDILAGADRALEMSTRNAVDHVESTGRAATGAVAASAAAGVAAVAATGRSVAQKIEDTKAKMDLDFNLDDGDKPAPMRPVARAEPALATASTASTASDRLARPAAAMELDKLDLSFDPDKATFEDPTPSVLDGQWHDAATKLDLAKAYQEMGDVEGAREILQEVLHEGDDQQKTEAHALIAKLG